MPRVATVTVPVKVVPLSLPIRSQQKFFIVSPPSVCHRGQLQNVDRLSIRLVRERVEQRVQVVDRCHRVVIFGQRHDRDAHDFDRVVQAQRVAVFEVDRPDDVALALFELLGVEARDNHRC